MIEVVDATAGVPPEAQARVQEILRTRQRPAHAFLIKPEDLRAALVPLVPVEQQHWWSCPCSGECRHGVLYGRGAKGWLYLTPGAIFEGNSLLVVPLARAESLDVLPAVIEREGAPFLATMMMLWYEFGLRTALTTALAAAA